MQIRVFGTQHNCPLNPGTCVNVQYELFNFPNTAKCHVYLPNVISFGIFRATSSRWCIWLYNRQVRHFLIVFLDCGQVTDFFLYTFRLTWYFHEILSLLTYLLLIVGQYLHFLVLMDLGILPETEYAQYIMDGSNFDCLLQL